MKQSNQLKAYQHKAGAGDLSQRKNVGGGSNWKTISSPVPASQNGRYEGYQDYERDGGIDR